MDITIHPGPLAGAVSAIPSKSQAHRLLICAAFADGPTTIFCPETNRDIEATAACLRALGKDIQRTDRGYTVVPSRRLRENAVLPCGESGSTLRFLLPVVGALGLDATFLMEGQLGRRPLSPLWEEMERMGCRLTRPEENTIRCQGQLRAGDFTMDGGVSSQFISGLLFAAALLPAPSQIHILGTLESRPYVEMTQDALRKFGIDTKELCIPGGQSLHSPGELSVEGDWSSAAFFLGARALGSSVTVDGVSRSSCQGDQAIENWLPKLEHFCTVSAADIPDLVPILAVVAGARAGAVFTDIGRLRLKESDRVETVTAMIRDLGGEAKVDGNTLAISGTGYRGGTINSANDHRIAMAAAIAATVSSGPVTISDAHCVRKSYPSFWEEYQRLGGNYEQYLR